jgi:hypothetical protein
LQQLVLEHPSLEIQVMVEMEEIGVQMEAAEPQALVLLDQTVLEELVELLVMQFQIPQV